MTLTTQLPRPLRVSQEAGERVFLQQDEPLPRRWEDAGPGPPTSPSWMPCCSRRRGCGPAGGNSGEGVETGERCRPGMRRGSHSSNRSGEVGPGAEARRLSWVPTRRAEEETWRLIARAAGGPEPPVHDHRRRCGGGGGTPGAGPLLRTLVEYLRGRLLVSRGVSIQASVRVGWIQRMKLLDLRIWKTVLIDLRLPHQEEGATGRRRPPSIG